MVFKKLIPEFARPTITMIWQTLRAFGLKGFASELLFRLRPSPDGHPLPPSRMVFQVVGHGSQRDYYCAGEAVFLDIVAQLKSLAIEVGGFKSVLDFGCGCGRILRHWPNVTNAKLLGTDYNRELVHWCRGNLRCATFNENKLTPGLPYSNDSIDFIYAISVFTHLSPTMQKEWLLEIQRVLSKDGILYFTAHGHKFARYLNREELKQFRAGRCVIRGKDVEGRNDYGSFFSKEYVEKNLLPLGFSQIEYISGRDDEDYMQDAYILRKVS